MLESGSPLLLALFFFVSTDRFSSFGHRLYSLENISLFSFASLVVSCPWSLGLLLNLRTTLYYNRAYVICHLSSRGQMWWTDNHRCQFLITPEGARHCVNTQDSHPQWDIFRTTTKQNSQFRRVPYSKVSRFRTTGWILENELDRFRIWSFAPQTYERLLYHR